MKTRLAKKIMRQGYPQHGSINPYWVSAWVNYNCRNSKAYHGKADHRIIKAVSLTSKKNKTI